MSEIIAALIGCLVGVLGSYFTLRFNYRQLFAETVSQSRNHWLNEMRENISVMLAEACKCVGPLKSKEYYIAQNQVLLRMNNVEPLHLMLTKEIRELERSGSAADFRLHRDNILTISEKLLKREWEHVKDEAKGGK